MTRRTFRRLAAATLLSSTLLAATAATHPADPPPGRPDCGPSGDSNVYRQQLLRAVQRSALQDAQRWTAELPTNPWHAWWVGERLVALSYAAACADTRDTGLRDAARTGLVSLLRAARAGRWWDGRNPTGDDNLDRFVLLACLEAFYFQRRSEGDAFEPLPPDAQRALRTALQVQRETYGLARGSNPFRGHYANQDIVYALLLVHGHLLGLGEGASEEAAAVLARVAASQLPDGGFRYIGGENESPSYHGLVAALVARYFQLTHAPAALDIVRKSAGYWPSVLTDEGSPEYWSAPWWKQYWARPSLAGLSVVRALTGDRRLAFYETQARASGSMSTAPGGYQDVVAAVSWRPLPAVDYRPRRQSVAWDESLRGIRGRRGNLYFGFIAGGGFRNTFVGARVEGPAPGRARSILGGIHLMDTEDGVPRWLSGAADLVHGTTAHGEALFCARYGLNPTTINAWPQPAVPASPVSASQVWWTEGRQIRGLLKVRRSGSDAATGRPVTLVARFAGAPIEQVAENRYRAGDFTIDIDGCEVTTAIRKAPMRRGDSTPFEELVASTPGAKSPSTDADFAVSISARGDGPSPDGREDGCASGPDDPGAACRPAPAMPLPGAFDASAAARCLAAAGARTP